MADTRKTIVLLTAVLLALVAVSGVLLFVFSPSDSDTTVTETPSSAADIDTNLIETRGVDTSIFSQNGYTSLDTSLIQQGVLPVRPPATVGKGNPFL